MGLYGPASMNKGEESDEKKERELWFFTHSKNEYPSFISRYNVPHILKCLFFSRRRV